VPQQNNTHAKGKGLCEDLKDAFFLSSSSIMERKNQIIPCHQFIKKGSHSKSTCIGHKAKKSLKGNAPKLQCLDHSFD